jgi:hypothetical protein
MMLAVRFGGLVCLKYVNEGNPSVIELLNPLLELEQQFLKEN